MYEVLFLLQTYRSVSALLSHYFPSNIQRLNSNTDQLFLSFSSSADGVHPDLVKETRSPVLIQLSCVHIQFWLQSPVVPVLVEVDVYIRDELHSCEAGLYVSCPRGLKSYSMLH